MRETLDSMIQGLPPPSSDDYAFASRVLSGDISASGFENGNASKLPHIYDLQLKALAYGRVVSRVKGRTKGTAFTAEDHAKAQKAIDLRHQQAAMVWLNAGKRYETATLIEAMDTDALLMLKNHFDKSHKTGVMLCGGVGVGKTYASLVYMASKLTRRQAGNGNWDYNGLFLPKPKLVELLDQGSDGFKQLEQYRKAQWLLIDDLPKEGEGRVTKALIARIEDFISYRYDNCLKTIITTNGTAEQISKTYGERVASRLAGAFLVYECDGVDFRKDANTQFLNRLEDK